MFYLFCQFPSFISITTYNFILYIKGTLILAVRIIKPDVKQLLLFYGFSHNTRAWIEIWFLLHLVLKFTPHTSCLNPSSFPSASQSPICTPHPPFSPCSFQRRTCCFLSSWGILAIQQVCKKLLLRKSSGLYFSSSSVKRLWAIGGLCGFDLLVTSFPD